MTNMQNLSSDVIRP